MFYCPLGKWSYIYLKTWLASDLNVIISLTCLKEVRLELACTWGEFTEAIDDNYLPSINSKWWQYLQSAMTYRRQCNYIFSHDAINAKGACVLWTAILHPLEYVTWFPFCLLPWPFKIWMAIKFLILTRYMGS